MVFICFLYGNVKNQFTDFIPTILYKVDCSLYDLHLAFCFGWWMVMNVLQSILKIPKKCVCLDGPLNK